MPSERVRRQAIGMATVFAAACLAMPAADAAPAADAPQPQRWVAPIVLTTSAPFVALPMPPSAYAKAMQPELRDLRVVDAQGERVPFAWLTALHPVEPLSERQHEATLYPMPARPGRRPALDRAGRGERGR